MLTQLANYLPQLLFAVAILAGSFLVWREAKVEDFDLEALFDAIFVGTFFALLTGRAATVVLNWQSFDRDWLSFFYLAQNPGFEAQWAILAGVLAFIIFVRQIKLDLWQSADLVVVGLAFWQFLLFLAQNLAGWYQNANQGILALILSLIILVLAVRTRRRLHFPGFASLTFVVAEAIMMLVLASFRLDGVYWWMILKSQLLWLAAVVLGVTLLYYKAKRDVFEDLTAFGHFLRQAGSLIVYFAQSKRARRKFKVKVKNFWAKRSLAAHASFVTFLATTKGVLNVKRFKK